MSETISVPVAATIVEDVPQIELPPSIDTTVASKPAIIFENTLEVNSPSATRRSVLKTIAAGVASMAIGTGATATGLGIAEWNNSSLSMAYLKPDFKKLTPTVPPELADKNLSNHNERYSPDFAGIVINGIQAYEQQGGKPFYKKPPYYMGELEMWKSFRRGYDKYGAPDIDTSGRPYEKAINFSGADFKKGTVNLYSHLDPGSSAKQMTDQRLAVAHIQNPQPDGPGEAIVKQTYGQMYNDAKDHIDHIRQGGQVSTSELFTYFLSKSNGDITTSLIDTTLFLKLTARANLKFLLNRDHFSTGFKPSYDNAKLLSEMFYDEFSSELPLDELVASVDEHSALNDYKGSENYKDYDPVNRAGTPYHIWNLFMLDACAHPVVSQKIVLGYYGMVDGIRLGAHGKIKIEADYHAAEQANQVRAIFNRYEVQD